MKSNHDTLLSLPHICWNFPKDPSILPKVDWDAYFKALHKSPYTSGTKWTILCTFIETNDIDNIIKLVLMGYPLNKPVEWYAKWEIWFPITYVLLNMSIYPDIHEMESLKVIKALVDNGADWKKEHMFHDKKVVRLEKVLTTCETPLDAYFSHITGDDEVYNAVMAILSPRT